MNSPLLVNPWTVMSVSLLLKRQVWTSVSSRRVTLRALMKQVDVGREGESERKLKELVRQDCKPQCWHRCPLKGPTVWCLKAFPIVPLPRITRLWVGTTSAIKSSQDLRLSSLEVCSELWNSGMNFFDFGVPLLVFLQLSAYFLDPSHCQSHLSFGLAKQEGCLAVHSQRTVRHGTHRETGGGTVLPGQYRCRGCR